MAFTIPEVTEALFIAEARDLGGLPADAAPEIAIAGRSNVGKSTLLNRLAGRKGLARTSKTPGRTRGLVMFSLRLGKGAPLADLRLIDLPGYGYAKVARTERNSWQPLIEGYTRRRKSLALFVILVDARRGLEGEERQLYEWLGTEHVPAQVVYTKVDKLSATERGLLKEQAARSFGAPRADPRLRRERRGACGALGAIFEAVVRGGRPSRPEPGLAAGRAGPLMAVNKAPQAFVIERMRPGDLDAVMEIERVSFRAPWSAQVFSEEMVRDWAHVDVVRDAAEGFLVAFGNYWLVADEIHLLNLATHPLARRAGHASRLLAHIIEFGRQHGCRIVTLEVRRSNAAALRLYRRFAFRPVGVRPNYYAEDQEDAIVMLLDLT